MLQFDFEESIGYWLTLSTQAFHRALTEEVAPHGITYRQSQVLAWLVIEGELSQAELASKMMVEPPTLVGILDRMERDGWITRNSCPTDRRKKLIRATAAAEPVWEKIAECGRRVRARATSQLTHEELQSLKEMLGRVLQSLGSESPIQRPLESLT
ncbi:MAG: MarR family winged helix-turn-helix transcriptional regulator [Pirellulales bacterium]